MDPMGIHGDSITVAPAMTLSINFQRMRDYAILMRSIGNFAGGCNVQFAVSTKRRYRSSEINPRVSRSSALASKATGYPIARCYKISFGIQLR
jgi:carbamoyl-phosphate synthase large subunit